MNYLKIYYDIILNAKHRGLNKRKLEGYFEKHHIIPKCYFKSRKIASYKENMVLLTGREHFLCHQLLWLANKSDDRLLYAYNKMSMRNKISSKQCEILKKAFSERSSKMHKGKIVSDETKLRMSLNHADIGGDKNPMFGVRRPGHMAPHFGHSHSEETKMKLSLIASGRKWSEETRAKMSISHQRNKIIKGGS